MDFFDKLGKKASETYKYTAEKTSKLAKEAKLKMAMNENKSKIEDIYKEIGRKVYMHHVNKETVDIEEFIEERCTHIDQISDEIEDQRKEVLNLKDKKQCENCYDEIAVECNYCPNCGFEQDKIQNENIEEKENCTEIKENIKTEENDDDE